jgi:cofilin
MSSGIAVDDACVTSYNELKLGHKYRYVLYKIADDNKSITVEATGAPSTTYDQFVAALPKADCRFAVYDFEYTVSEAEGPRNKILFVAWSPDTSKVKSKMMYASSKDTLKKSLVGLAKDIQATDASEIDYQTVFDACTRV